MTIRIQNRYDRQSAPTLPSDRTLPPPHFEPVTLINGAPRYAHGPLPLPPLRRIHEERRSETDQNREQKITVLTPGYASSPAYLSSIDTSSPNPILTPTISSASLSTSTWSQPTSNKRVKRDSVSNNGVRTHGGNRGKSDLAGLLNPAEDDPPVWSPRMPELEQVHASAATSVRSNSPQCGPISPVTTGGRSHEQTRFVRLQPRPLGQSCESENARDRDYDDEADRKRKGRRGPLKDDERRAEVLEVRALGACVRCAIFRIGCEATHERQACKPCMDTLPKARKFRVRCTRKWLKDRWEYLFPLSLTDHLDLKTGHGHYPEIHRGEYEPIFSVPMTPGFTRPFNVNAFAVKEEDIGRANTWATNWFNAPGDESGAKYELTHVLGMPMMPLLNDIAAFTPIRDQMADLASGAISSEGEASTWINEMFEKMAWPRQVLHMVTRFYREAVEGANDRCPALDIALRSCFLRWLMGRVFYIDHESLEEVNRRLPRATQLPPWHLKTMISQKNTVAPRFLDRFIKSAILEVVKNCLANTFYELDKAFRLLETKKEDQKLSGLSRDKIFCVIVVLLILAATTQNKILQKAQSKIREQWEIHTEEGRNAELVCADLKHEAHFRVKQVEEEVVDHVLDLWAYKFPKLEANGRIFPGEQRAAEEARRLQIIKEFQDSKAQDATLVGIPISLNLDDEDRFMATNVKRMLLRLDACLYKPKGPQRPAMT